MAQGVSEPDGEEGDDDGGDDVARGCDGLVASDEADGLPAYRREGGEAAQKANDEQHSRFFTHGDAEASPEESDKKTAYCVDSECAGDMDRSPPGVGFCWGDSGGDGEGDGVAGGGAEPAAEEDEEEVAHWGSLGGLE